MKFAGHVLAFALQRQVVGAALCQQPLLGCVLERICPGRLAQGQKVGLAQVSGPFHGSQQRDNGNDGCCDGRCSTSGHEKGRQDQ